MWAPRPDSRRIGPEEGLEQFRNLSITRISVRKVEFQLFSKFYTFEKFEFRKLKIYGTGPVPRYRYSIFKIEILKILKIEI